MEEKNVILVTWDFTEKSEYALEHAYLAAKSLNASIVLLHIVKKESEIHSFEERLHGIIADHYAKRDVKPGALVKVGTIFETIGIASEEIGAKMVFMGTHGIKGSQKFFGSWALKVIATTKVPFIVVQAPPVGEMYRDIVFPVNYRKENKESINWIGFFSRHFASKIHIFVAKHTDTNFIKGIESNILFLAKNFKIKGVEYVIENAPGETDFVKEAVDYTKKIKADSIFVVTTKDIGFTDYMLGAHEQYIIANNLDIPVICISPKPPKLGGSFSTSGS
jgi:nucleotide-binding universal stress UspA family protein